MIDLLLIAAIAIQPPLREPVEDRVDLLWVDHYYDGCGKLTFDQIIFADWREFDQQRGEYEIVAWRLINSPHRWPVRDHERGDWYVLFYDDHRWRLVRAPAYRETWSQQDVGGDPELNARTWWPQEQRRGLGGER